MGTSVHGKLAGDLVRGRSRLQAWRERREGRGRIPRRLWALAVRLAKKHGICRTATVLRLDYYSLKKQVEAVSDQGPSGSAAFVELASPVVVGKQCLFEQVRGAGAAKRVQLVGYDLAEVERFACRFWSVD